MKNYGRKINACGLYTNRQVSNFLKKLQFPNLNTLQRCNYLFYNLFFLTLLFPIFLFNNAGKNECLKKDFCVDREKRKTGKTTRSTMIMHPFSPPQVRRKPAFQLFFRFSCSIHLGNPKEWFKSSTKYKLDHDFGPLFWSSPHLHLILTPIYDNYCIHIQ